LRAEYPSEPIRPASGPPTLPSQGGRRIRKLLKAATTSLRPGDWLLAGAGLVLVAGLWFRQADSLEGRVVIRLDGKVVQEASLRLNRLIEVAGPLGISRIEIQAGRVRVATDPSPRQLCVHQGWIPPGGAAVCLPNRVSVENAAAGYDTLNY
jgi:hypothetical protein